MQDLASWPRAGHGSERGGYSDERDREQDVGDRQAELLLRTDPQAGAPGSNLAGCSVRGESGS